MGKNCQSDNFEVICSDAIDMLSGFAFVNHETGIGDAGFSCESTHSAIKEQFHYVKGHEGTVKV